MYCKNCGKEIDSKAVVCIHCGVGTHSGSNFCKSCGNPMQSGTHVCTRCGVAKEGFQKSRLVAGVLGVLLGGFGAHNFYLGNTRRAVAQILLTLLLFGTGWVWGIIEGVMIFTGNINCDANGIPLKNDM